MSHYLIGQQIENYRVEAMIGDGGMGTVFRALDVDLDRPVALKVMHPQFAAQGAFQERFQQEARAAARLNHPSIVQIYRFGRDADHLYIVMELIDGAGLGHHIRQLAETNRFVRLNETLLVLAQVADALGYGYRRGVIHRDIKPDNILVKPVDYVAATQELPLRAVVTDFGLAKLMEGGIQTQTGTFIGSLPYMSPEQVLGTNVDGRSDIYSLGVVLYQLATSRLPFDIRTPTDAVMQHLNQQPPEPHLLQPGLPLVVENVILTALAKKPEHRYQSSDEMATALRNAAAQLSDSEVAGFAGADKAVSIIKPVAAPEPAVRATPPPAVPITIPPAPVATDAHDDATIVPPSQESTAVYGKQTADHLLISHEDNTPRNVPLSADTVRLGRADDNEVVLASLGVSHHHAHLEKQSDGWYVTDLQSTNGTYLGDRRLPPHQAQPWPEDVLLRISDHFLQLRMGQPAAGSAVLDKDSTLHGDPAVSLPALEEPAVSEQKPRRLLGCLTFLFGMVLAAAIISGIVFTAAGVLAYLGLGETGYVWISIFMFLVLGLWALVINIRWGRRVSRRGK